MVISQQRPYNTETARGSWPQPSLSTHTTNISHSPQSPRVGVNTAASCSPSSSWTGPMEPVQPGPVDNQPCQLLFWERGGPWCDHWYGSWSCHDTEPKRLDVVYSELRKNGSSYYTLTMMLSALHSLLYTLGSDHDTPGRCTCTCMWIKGHGLAHSFLLDERLSLQL